VPGIIGIRGPPPNASSASVINPAILGALLLVVKAVQVRVDSL
jgi:hypothetical protein